MTNQSLSPFVQCPCGNKKRRMVHNTYMEVYTKKSTLTVGCVNCYFCFPEFVVKLYLNSLKEVCYSLFIVMR